MRGFVEPGRRLRVSLLLGAAMAAAIASAAPVSAQMCTGCGPNGPTDQDVVAAGSGQAAMPASALTALTSFSTIVGDRQDRNGRGAPANGTPLGYAAETRGEPKAAAIFSAMAQAPWQPVWAIWAQAYGSRNVVGDTATLPGYSSGAGGFVVGLDRQASAELLYGIALGYSRTSTTGAAMRGTSDAYSAALYATWMPGPWSIEGRIGSGYVQNASARSVPFPGAVTTADGSAGAYDLLLNLEVGYRMQVGAVAVKPYAGLAWQSLTRDGFTETGPFGVTFPRQTFVKAVSTIGIGGSLLIQGTSGILWAPEVKIGWGHDLRDDTLVTQATFAGAPYVILAAPPGADAAVVSAALSAATSDVQTFTISYGGDFRANAQTHMLAAGFRRQW